VSLAPPRLALVRRRFGSVVLSAGLAAGAFVGLGAAPALAAVVCNTDSDVCVVVPDTVQTPLGLVTVTADSANVVTVHLDATSPTFVFGVPFSYPPGPPVLPGYTRTTIDTTGGLVTIDTIQMPPGPPTRIAIRNIAIISIHPPSPCRARTTGSTVVFTPRYPPGPPV
jgi:hypothetical protein